jgi:hypothetical protein
VGVAFSVMAWLLAGAVMDTEVLPRVLGWKPIFGASAEGARPP